MIRINGVWYFRKKGLASKSLATLIEFMGGKNA